MEINTILIWMLCGLIVGFVARVLLPGPQDIGLVMTMLLGIVGAIVGGIIYSYIRGPLNEPLAFAGEWQPWIVAVVGAMLVIWLYVAAVTRRRSYRRYYY